MLEAIDLNFSKHRVSVLGIKFAFAVVSVFLIGTTLISEVALAAGTDAHKYRKVSIKLPQTFKDTLTTEHYGTGNMDGANYGFGCDQGEAVKTCDANTSMDETKVETWVGAKTVLGPATNTALFGIKRKTICTVTEIKDSSGIEGCLYESCLGYKKPVVMVCMSK
jgi:hypothetical protein